MSFYVTEIVVYPVKSLGGCKVERWFAETIGFEYDRSWVIIDGVGNMITQREMPVLALFDTAINENQIMVYLNDDKIVLSEDGLTKEISSVMIWDDKANVFLANQTINDWFSERLNTDVKVGRLVDNTSRKHYSGVLDKTIAVSMADGYPYLIIGTESLKNLNSQLETPINMDRFRPNIVIQTNTPHEEDELNNFKIGEVSFKNIKPCARCNITTINQQTAEVGKEPLKTLATYRRHGNGVNFGTNVLCLNSGYISVGDQLKPYNIKNES